MYIEDRLFSETSDEVFYSVTMTEDEYDLFSEFLEERQYALPSMETLQGVKRGLTHVQKAKALMDRKTAEAAKSATKAVRQSPLKRLLSTPSGKGSNAILMSGGGSKVQKVKANTNRMMAADAVAATKKPLKPSPNGSFTSQWGGRTWTSTLS